MRRARKVRRARKTSRNKIDPINLKTIDLAGTRRTSVHQHAPATATAVMPITIVTGIVIATATGIVTVTIGTLAETAGIAIAAVSAIDRTAMKIATPIVDLIEIPAIRVIRCATALRGAATCVVRTSGCGSITRRATGW